MIFVILILPFIKQVTKQVYGLTWFLAAVAPRQSKG